ncbi:MAG: ABC transporter ATP-binding protein/permease [Candidatus Kaiserbacteria bacterium]|nr:ABC transporter ATP-binding protein/permease [Candidatus Kaiserbacteria bacterium]
MTDAYVKKLASAKQVFRVYYRHVAKYPFLVLLIAFGSIGIQVTDLAAPWFLRQFFNLLATQSPNTQTVSQLLGIIVTVAGIWVLNWASHRVQEFSNQKMEAQVMTDLFSSAFKYLIGHSYNFFISNFAGSLTHRVTKFARAFEVMFDSIALQFFPTSLFVVGAISILYLRNHSLGIALGIWSILFVAFQVFASKRRQPIRAARSLADTRVTGTLADAISNHPTIMLFSGASHEHKLFSAVVEVWRKATTRSWFTDSWIWAGLGIFMIVIEVGLLWGATIYWGRGLLSIGDFVLIQAYLMTTFDRLLNINRELRRFNDAFADSSEMVYIMEQEHEIKDAPNARALSVQKGEISFNHINFSFNANRQILKNLNLVIRGGELVALVGPSGAGKSTVTKLLLRMFDIKDGGISIDGQNIASVTQDSLRDAISHVPQEPVLFHRSLLENIRYGRRSATDEEVIEASKKAHCHEFISNLNQGYGTFVGERGVKLSGGERQRVAIARAILKDSPILVLDEATSSLDSESESLIQDALQTLMKDKTVIVIAHRLSTIMKMDRIIVLEGGQIIAEGTHSELLEGKGLYQKLWQIQAGGFAGESVPEELDLEEDNIEDKEKEPPKVPKMK